MRGINRVAWGFRHQSPLNLTLNVALQSEVSLDE